jgi:hypothetical protein
MRAHSKIVVIQAVTAIVAVAALIASLTILADRVNAIEQSRYDSCRLLRNAVLIAGAHNTDQRPVRLFLKRAGLDDCHAYAAGAPRTP